MSRTTEDSFSRIEEIQAALRDSIEQAKALALESERLIRPPRDEVDPEPEPPNPA